MMKNSRSLIIAATIALALSTAAIQPAAAADVNVTPTTVAGTVLGAVALHMLTGGASTAWQVVATIFGGGAGYVVAEKVDKK